MSALIGLLVLLSGCATTPPQEPDNACEIFRQYPDWYTAAKQSENKWGTAVPILLAFIHQESSFQPDAQPGRSTFLGFIPGPRKSSSYGYTQAIDTTWEEYQEKTDNFYASRGNFADAVDFIGWYNYQGFLRNGIERNQTYYMYIAYHEGHGGYTSNAWKNKKWLTDVSTKVANRAIEYHKQLKSCGYNMSRSPSSINGSSGSNNGSRKSGVNSNESWWVF